MSSGDEASWDLNVWKMETIHWIAWWLSLPQEVGTVGILNDMLALGSALVVHDQVGGWEEIWQSTALGTAGGENRVLNIPLGKAW